MDLMAILLMLLAAALWGCAAFREADSSDKLEWVLCGLMLNAAAMVLWNLERGPVAMLAHWLPYALAAATSTLLLHLCAAWRQDGTFGLRRLFPPIAYVAMTLSIGFAAPDLQPAQQPTELRGDAGPLQR